MLEKPSLMTRIVVGKADGFIIGYFATRFGGEGAETVTKMPNKSSELKQMR